MQNNFALQNVPHTAELCFSGVEAFFLEIYKKTSIQEKKSDYHKEAWNYAENYYFSKSEKGLILRK